MTSLKKHVKPITASLVCPYKPFTAFWGVVLTTPPIFELANQSAPFSHVMFALDQSERSIFSTTNQKPDQKVSLWCAYHYSYLTIAYSIPLHWVIREQILPLDKIFVHQSLLIIYLCLLDSFLQPISTQGRSETHRLWK